METITLDTTYTETTQMGIHQVARELAEALGPTLVAVLAGVKDRKLPPKWALPTGPTPRAESERKLRTAHRVFTALARNQDAHIARSWFIGLNPLLDEMQPVVALNEGRDREVIEAARSYLRDIVGI